MVPWRFIETREVCHFAVNCVESYLQGALIFRGKGARIKQWFVADIRKLHFVRIVGLMWVSILYHALEFRSSRA